ncbi:hypothetical protein BLOT_014629 [Blomia tropicalis]|nr:hypothetical protein BLOT_014629 [Blomia tropicalis]
MNTSWLSNHSSIYLEPSGWLVVGWFDLFGSSNHLELDFDSVSVVLSLDCSILNESNMMVASSMSHIESHCKFAEH